MLTGAYQGFFTAIAGASAALTGLLFVALSVTSRSRLASYPTVIRDVRAAAFLLAFTNVLTVSLFSLVPETNTGDPALVAGVFGLMFTAAGVRSIIACRRRRRYRCGARLASLSRYSSRSGSKSPAASSSSLNQRVGVARR